MAKDAPAPVRYFVNLYGSERALRSVRDMGLDIIPPSEDRAPARTNTMGALIPVEAFSALLDASVEIHILSSTAQQPPLEVTDDAAAFLEGATGRKYR